MRTIRLALVVQVGFMMLFLGSWTKCSLGPGSPDDPDGSTIRLGVPFFTQVYEISFCGAATVEMWAAYKGRSYSQFVIADWLGATQNSAEPFSETVQGVFHFAGVPDVYLEYNGGQDSDVADFLAREVASANNREPMIDEFVPWHRVIVNGGKWTRDRINDRRIWDYVYYNDPLVGAYRQDPGGLWRDKVAGHIISSGATTNWAAGLELYGGNTYLRLSRTRLEKPIL